MPFQLQPELHGEHDDDGDELMDPAGAPQLQDWDDFDAELALQLQYEQEHEAEENEYPTYIDAAAAPSDASDGVFIASKRNKQQNTQKTAQNGTHARSNAPPHPPAANMNGTNGKLKGKTRETIDLADYEDDYMGEDMVFDDPQKQVLTDRKTTDEYEERIDAVTYLDIMASRCSRLTVR